MPVPEEDRRVARGDRAARRAVGRTSPWLAVRLRRRCADDELVAEVDWINTRVPEITAARAERG